MCFFTTIFFTALIANIYQTKSSEYQVGVQRLPSSYTHADLAELMYNSADFRNTRNSNIPHGLSGFEGLDYAIACGQTLYSPLPGIGTVMYNGTDNYIGPYAVNKQNPDGTYGQENTMLRIVGDAGEIVLFHGIYDIQVGELVEGGKTIIGKSASIGNSTGCHEHLVWRPNNSYEPPVIQEVSGFGDTANQLVGYISAYDKSPTDQTMANRTKWGQMPPNPEHYDMFIAVLDCSKIGRPATLDVSGKTFNAWIFDCAGIEDGGAEWMVRGNYIVEIDWYAWQVYPELIGAIGVLSY